MVYLYSSSYLEFLRDLEEKVDQDWEGISLSLEEIRKSLLTKKHCLVNLTADGKNITNSEKHIGKFLDSLPDFSSEPNTWNTQLSSQNEAIVIPTQVIPTFFPLNSSVQLVFRFYVLFSCIVEIIASDEQFPLFLLRSTMLGKLLMYMEVVISLVEVLMSFRNISVIHGCGIVYE